MLRLLAVVAASVLPATAFAHDVMPRPEMSVVLEPASYGKSIKNGRYDYAIEKLTAPRRTKRHEHLDRINLCVAYAKLGKLEQAEEVCDSALVLVRNRLAEERDDELKIELTRFEAVALSNRGVVRIASGDYAAAERDFREALEVTAAVPAPQRNLAYLASRRARN